MGWPFSDMKVGNSFRKAPCGESLLHSRDNGCRSCLLTNKTRCLIVYKTISLVSGSQPVARSMKKRQLPSVTGAELKVLESLWERSEATIRDLRDMLYPDGGQSKFATVQKLLARLTAKRLVRRRKDAGGWVFQPVIARDDLIGG
jgi:hypothetical protein